MATSILMLTEGRPSGGGRPVMYAYRPLSRVRYCVYWQEAPNPSLSQERLTSSCIGLCGPAVRWGHRSQEASTVRTASISLSGAWCPDSEGRG